MSNAFSMVRKRIAVLEESLPPDMDALDRYQQVEQICIAILDSEFMDHPEGELELYLLQFLTQLRRELNISDNSLS